MPQTCAGGVEGTLPVSGDCTIALRKWRSGGKGDDLNEIQHIGFFATPGAALKGDEFKGPMPMQGQAPKGGGAALEKGNMMGMNVNNDTGLNAGKGGRQEK